MSVYRTIGPLVISCFDDFFKQTEKPMMELRVLRRHILGYSVCLCPIKRSPGLYGLSVTCINGGQSKVTRIGQQQRTRVAKKFL